MAKNKKGHPSTSRVIIFLMTVSSEIFVYVCMKKRKDSKKGKKGIFRSLQEEKRFISSTDMWERKIISKRFRVEKKRPETWGLQAINKWTFGTIINYILFYVYRKLGLWVRGSLSFFFYFSSLYLSHSLIFPSSIWWVKK